MKKIVLKSLLFICMVMICKKSYNQINYNKINSSIKDCGINIFERKYDSEKNILYVQTDSINSYNFSIFVFEPFAISIPINEYDRIDSLIQTRYKDTEILSSQRTAEDKYVLYWYVTKNKKGDYITDKYAIINYENTPLLIYYSSVLGRNPLNFDRFECVIKEIEQWNTNNGNN